MRYVRRAAIVLALNWLVPSAFADTLTLNCSFVGAISQDITYNVNRDTKEVEVIGGFGTHKAMLFGDTEVFFYVWEPNLGASVATIFYLGPGETPVGIRSTLGLLNEDQFKGIADDLKLSSENLRYMAVSGRGRCQQEAAREPGVAGASRDTLTRNAVGELSGELHACSVYFGVVSRCVKPQKPDVATTYRRASNKIGELALSGARTAGLSNEAFVAQETYFNKAMMKAMNENCSNIQVLLNKYLEFCEQLNKDADPRLKEWIACLRAGQQTCGGLLVP